MGLLDDYEAERQTSLSGLPQRLIGKGVASFWQSLPPEVRAQYAAAPEGLARLYSELSTPGAIRDTVTAVGDTTRAAVEGRGWDTASNAARAVTAAAGVVPGAKLVEKLGQKAAEEVVPAIQKGLLAYHGSPHSFDKFDLAKVGTGEGTQAFGHGVYLAENPKVAETYRPEGGHMYEVKVNADPKRIIDDDLPLQRSGVPMDVIEKWREAKTAEERMTILRDAGFQGRKYLDQGSREGGKGTSNYVIFDPSIIEILRKYGMLPVAAGGAAATVPGLLADDQGGV